MRHQLFHLYLYRFKKLLYKSVDVEAGVKHEVDKVFPPFTVGKYYMYKTHSICYTNPEAYS